MIFSTILHTGRIDDGRPDRRPTCQRRRSVQAWRRSRGLRARERRASAFGHGARGGGSGRATAWERSWKRRVHRRPRHDHGAPHHRCRGGGSSAAPAPDQGAGARATPAALVHRRAAAPGSRPAGDGVSPGADGLPAADGAGAGGADRRRPRRSRPRGDHRRATVEGRERPDVGAGVGCAAAGYDATLMTPPFGGFRASSSVTRAANAARVGRARLIGRNSSCPIRPRRRNLSTGARDRVAEPVRRRSRARLRNEATAPNRRGGAGGYRGVARPGDALGYGEAGRPRRQ